MGEEKIDYFSSSYQNMVINGSNNSCDSISATSSSFEDSTSSIGSSSDLSEDASSPLKGPLYELSELMAHLPIKRGLSRHFQGKSQSFTSLSNVRCIEDLAKRENPYKKRMKSCKSYGGGLDTQKRYIPKTCGKIISKKGSKGSFSSLLGKNIGSFVGRSKPPIHVQRRTCDV